MKKSVRGNRRAVRARRRKPLEAIVGQSHHKRRMWTFEHLEERHFLSATPLSDITPVMYSSSTAEGLQQILLNEIIWAERQSNPSATVDDVLAELRALPNDPYLHYQWHLINTGQSVGNPDWQEILAAPGEDINVLPAWLLGYTGEGVYVAVVDTGIELDHPDLAANISSIYRFNSATGGTNVDPIGPHGTSVAGLIAAVGDNGVGMTGVAYDATLVPILLGAGDLAESNALRYASQVIDIYNNSWGPSDATRVATAPGPEATLALRDGVTFGRDPDGPGGADPLGSIYVWASGNGAGPFAYFSPGWNGSGVYDSAQYDGYVNSRYTIGVGGIDADGHYNNVDGTVTTYMESSPAILVVAPTGSVPIDVGLDTGTGSGVWTTDMTGDDGYNQAPAANGYEFDRDFFGYPDYEGDYRDYTSRFNGTSASAPIVSGVIALMLEANPNLSWRDVQEILVRSARQADIEDPVTGDGFGNEQSWLVNYRDFFRIPSAIEQTGPVSADFNAVDWVFNPTPVVSAFGNPANYPDDLYFNYVVPFVVVIPPIPGDPNAVPAIPGTPGQVYFLGTYEPPYAPMYTNGAGYTVSAGRGAFGDEFGYGHGVVDAELAVQLARQWTIQNQELPPELTFTQYVEQSDSLVIEAGVIASEEALEILVPGAFSDTDEGFIDFWEEYFAEDDPTDPADGPFSAEDEWDGGTPVDRGGSFYFQVPDSNAMKVEWVEVKVDISNASEDLNFLRLTLVSPSGTQSELISQFPNPETPYSLQQAPASQYIIGGLEPIADGSFVWTFSSNRNWGERYDNQLYIDGRTQIADPVTGLLIDNPGFGKPVLDDAGTPFDTTDDGFAVEAGWQLVAENYSGTDIDIEGWEIVWHGSPIDPNSQRIQGMVGVDSGYLGDGARDGQFAFSRYSQKTESGAANVTVVAENMETGVKTKFVTGADGNFYFDLITDAYADANSDGIPDDSDGDGVPDPPDGIPDQEYRITVEDPLGRTAMDEASVPGGTLPLYQQEWHLTPDYFYQPDGYGEAVLVPNLPNRPVDVDEYAADRNFRIYDNGAGAPVHFTDITGVDILAGPTYIDFLLDPGPLPPNQTVVSGQVFADVDGDGVYNNDDAPAVDFVVYADTNHTGQFEISDPYTLTDSSGQYQLNIFNVAGTQQYDIGAVAPTAGWEQTSPEGGTRPILAYAGAIYTDYDFGFEPIVIPDPLTSEPVAILGKVFNDANGNGVGEADEVGPGVPGAAGFHVYVDLDGDGHYTTGEPQAISGPNGAFFIPNVDPPDQDPDPQHVVRTATVRIEVASPWELTVPASGYRQLDLPLAGSVSGVLFGVHNTATRDFGDLPNETIVPGARYDIAPDGSFDPPSHTILLGFRLGAMNPDGEVSSQPSLVADGDDYGSVDEDGVVVLDAFGNPDPNRILRSADATDPDATKLRVTVAGVGGLLTGWIDFNGDGDFQDAGEKLTWKDPEGNIVQEVDLNPGTYDLPITVPTNLASGQVAARFRWGPAGLDYYGPTIMGEVEDYFFDPPATEPFVFPDGDYNTDGIVDDSDYDVWRSTFGSTQDLRADGNDNGTIDAADYSVWRDNFEAAASGSGSGSILMEGDGSSADTTTVPDPDFAAYMESLGFQRITMRVGSGTQTFYYLPASTAPAAGSQTDVKSLSNVPVEASPLSVNISGLQFTTTVDNRLASLVVQQTTSQDGTASTADLQLLDQVLGQIALENDDEQVDDPLALRQDDRQDDEATDLAVAAVFDDEAPWWLGV